MFLQPLVLGIGLKEPNNLVLIIVSFPDGVVNLYFVPDLENSLESCIAIQSFELFVVAIIVDVPGGEDRIWELLAEVSSDISRLNSRVTDKL